MSWMQLRRHLSRTGAPLVLAVVVGVFLLPSSADARRGEAPYSPVGQGPIGEPLLRVDAPDVAMLKAQDRDRKEAGVKTLRYAEPIEVSLSPQTDGSWSTLPDGSRLWRMEIEGPKATDINLGLRSFRLPYDGKFWLISTERDYYEGPYTHEDNEEHGELWVPVVPGDRVILELQVPAQTKFEPTLEISQVGYGYIDVFSMNGLPKQGSCNNDVVCPEGDPWRDQIQSVAAYSLGGSIFCTGQMITDADQTFRPFFLTAYHCGLTPANAPSLTVYWNFESPNCGDLTGGSLADNQTGAVWRSSRQDVDMCLVELDDFPDPASQVYYTGWDRSGDVPTGSVAIHHPNGDEKAISFNTDALTTQSSCIFGSSELTHWRVNDWEDGTTEPGSSGSGLWNPGNKLLVGFLSGGLASCTNIDYDCYGKFSVAWDGTTADSRLRDWLDPNDTGGLQVQGSYPSLDGILAFEGATGVDRCNGVTDGVIEPGESVELSVSVQAGIADVSGITGTLTSLTPGVSIGVAAAAWPDIPVNTTASNLTPFELLLDPSVPCYSDLDFTLELTDALGQNFTRPFSLPVGLVQSPGGLPLAIPDGSSAGITSEFTVGEDVTLTDLDVYVQINHSYVGDLTVEITSPSGTTVTLLDRPGVPTFTFGCSDDNMLVTFDDDATQELESYCAGTDPWYNGSALPVTSLSALNGESTAGTWTLFVSDSAGFDTGQIVSWELIATPELGAGECDPCTQALPSELAVSSAAAVPVSLIVVPDGGGTRLDAALAWDGVPGNRPDEVDASITARVTDSLGNPVSGWPAQDIVLGSTLGSLMACSGTGTADGPTDANGETTFSSGVAAGGAIDLAQGEKLTVEATGLTSTYAGGGVGLDIRFNSPDFDGNGTVDISDVGSFGVIFFAGYDYAADFFWDGVLNLSDVAELGDAVGASCAGAPEPSIVTTTDASLRVVFDLAEARTSRPAQAGEIVDAWVVLDGPVARAGIRGWEARLRTSDNLEVLSTEPVAGSFDVLDGPDFAVASKKAVTKSEQGPVALARLRLRAVDERPAYLYVEASSKPSQGAKGPVVLTDEGLRAVATTTEPVAALNDQIDTAPEAAPVTAYSLGNAPNPFNPRTEIQFALPQRGTVEIRVFDVAGRLVRRFDLGSVEAGRHSITWSGEDQSGRGVVSGVYFSRLFVDGAPRGGASKMSLLK